MNGATVPVTLAPQLQEYLLEVAHASIRRDLDGRTDLPDLTTAPPRLRQPGASFVTLSRNGSLLGCIGSMEPVRALVVDVAHNASASAFGDPRLPPVRSGDLAEMRVKISVLGPMERMVPSTRDDLTRALRPRIDGLLVVAGQRRGTFLPSVWEQVADPGRFLDLLWDKAGLAHRTWPSDLAIYRYSTLEFGD
jgi:uncharacterized protein